MERPLGSESFVYIRERLAHGHSMARALNDCLDIENGNVFAYLPEGLPDEAAHDFTEGVLPTPPKHTWRRIGGGTMIPTPNTNERLVSHIAALLATRPVSFAVFEEWAAKATDPFWQKQPNHLGTATFVGDEVYYVVQTSDTQPIAEAVKWAGGAWPGMLGAVVDGDCDLRDNAEHWALMARATIELVIGAYDGESYLVWTPT